MDCENSWQKFAGPQSYLFIKEHQKIKTIDLLDSFQKTETELQILFNSFKDNSWLKRYLTTPSNLEMKTQWVESRICLLKVASHFSFSSLKIFTSISHTQNYSIAIGLQRTAENILGIGIDIEDKTRTISERAKLKFAHLAELDLGLSPLEIWIIKEACFKASSLLPGAFISKYIITTYNREQRQGVAVLKSSPDFYIYFKLIEQVPNLIGFAIAKNGPQDIFS